jgi:hypothetical protein
MQSVIPGTARRRGTAESAAFLVHGTAHSKGAGMHPLVHVSRKATTWRHVKMYREGEPCQGYSQVAGYRSLSEVGSHEESSDITRNASSREALSGQ